MRIHRALLLAVAVLESACASSSSDAPSLDGNWIYVNDQGTAGLGVTFNGDGTYTAFVMAMTSQSSADAEVETGLFTTQAGAVTFTPREWTCPGPDPASTVKYTFSNGNLLLSFPSGIISLQQNTASSDEAFSITYGCFDRKTHTFIRSQLAPVDN